MLYVYTGNDMVSVRARAHARLDAYVEQGIVPDHVEAEECAAALLRDRIGAQSLFGAGEPQVTLLDMPSEQKEALDVILALAPELGESQNIFVLIDTKLLAPATKVLKEHATEFEVLANKETERFNVFALADALARRDKKSLWVLLMRAYAAGLSGEELTGTLLWQLKTMRLAARTKSAEEAGMKPFVYTKAKRGLAKFTNEELDERSCSLVSLYHDAHLGKRDMEMGLERWVLGV